MKNWIEHLAQDRRLVILRLLAQTGGAGNDSVLLEGVRQIGHIAATRKHVREDIRFLEERGAVTIEYFNDVVVVATLTERGLDCVEGRVQIEGVKKPSLGGG